MTIWKQCEIKGDWLNDDYTVNDLAVRRYLVEVSNDGSLRDPETGEHLIAERWGDGEYVTNDIYRFSPDADELSRIGCKVKLCGSAINSEVC